LKISVDKPGVQIDGDYLSFLYRIIAGVVNSHIDLIA